MCIICWKLDIQHQFIFNQSLIAKIQASTTNHSITCLFVVNHFHPLTSHHWMKNHWIHVLHFLLVMKCLWSLTPKGRSPSFGPFLEFGQAIVDAIFFQKISNFWWTCGLVLASRCTNFYKISIFGCTIMLQKHFFFGHIGSFGQPKNFLFHNFLDLIFFHKFLTKVLNISSTWKSSKIYQIY